MQMVLPADLRTTRGAHPRGHRGRRAPVAVHKRTVADLLGAVEGSEAEAWLGLKPPRQHGRQHGRRFRGHGFQAEAWLGVLEEADRGGALVKKSAACLPITFT